MRDGQNRFFIVSLDIKVQYAMAILILHRDNLDRHRCVFMCDTVFKNTYGKFSSSQKGFRQSGIILSSVYCSHFGCEAFKIIYIGQFINAAAVPAHNGFKKQGKGDLYGCRSCILTRKGSEILRCLQTCLLHNIFGSAFLRFSFKGLPARCNVSNSTLVKAVTQPYICATKVEVSHA